MFGIAGGTDFFGMHLYEVICDMGLEIVKSHHSEKVKKSLLIRCLDYLYAACIREAVNLRFNALNDSIDSLPAPREVGTVTLTPRRTESAAAASRWYCGICHGATYATHRTGTHSSQPIARKGTHKIE